MSKQALPYGVGRRTGKNLLAGKTIRKLSNGMDNFDDYWSDTSADDDSIFRITSCDTPITNPPNARLNSTLRSMTPFSDSSRGTSVEFVPTGPKTRSSKPLIKIKSPQCAGPTPIAKRVTRSTDLGVGKVGANKSGVSNPDTNKLGTSNLSINEVGTSRQSATSLGLTLNPGGDDVGTISRNETTRSCSVKLSPIQSFNTKKRLTYSAGSDRNSITGTSGSIQVSSTTENTKITFAPPIGVAPKRSRPSTNQITTEPSENQSTKQILTEPHKRQSHETKSSAKVATRKSHTTQKSPEKLRSMQRGDEDANVEKKVVTVEGFDASADENEATANENDRPANENMLPVTIKGIGTTAEESNLEETRESIEETDETMGENENTGDESEQSAKIKEVSVSKGTETTAKESNLEDTRESIEETEETTGMDENEDTGDESEQSAKKKEAIISKGTETMTEESTLEECRESNEKTEETMGENEDTADESDQSAKKKAASINEDVETMAETDKTINETNASLNESKGISDKTEVTMDDYKETPAEVLETISKNKTSRNESKEKAASIEEPTVHDSETTAEENEGNEIEASIEKGNTTTDEKQVGHEKVGQDIEAEHNDLEPADDISESSAAVFVSLNQVGHTKSITPHVTVNDIAIDSMDELDSQHDDFEIITREVVLKKPFRTFRKSQNNTNDQKSSNKTIQNAQTKNNQSGSLLQNKSVNLKINIDARSDSKDDEQVQVKKLRTKPSKSFKKNTSLQEESNKQGIDEETENQRPTKSIVNKQNNKTATDNATKLRKAKVKSSGMEQNSVKRKTRQLLKGHHSASKSSDSINGKQENISNHDMSCTPVKENKPKKERQVSLSKSKIRKYSKKKLPKYSVKPKKERKRGNSAASRSLDFTNDGQGSTLDQELPKELVKTKEPQQNNQNTGISKITDKANREHVQDSSVEPANSKKGRRTSSSISNNDQEIDVPVLPEPLVETTKNGQQREKPSSYQANMKSLPQSLVEPVKEHIKKRPKKGKLLSPDEKNSDTEPVLAQKVSEKPVKTKKGKLRSSSPPNTKSPAQVLVEEPIKTSTMGQHKGKPTSNSAENKNRGTENNTNQELLKKHVQVKKGKPRGRRASSQPNIKSLIHSLFEEPLKPKMQQQKSHGISQEMSEKNVKVTKGKQRGRRASSAPNTKLQTRVLEEEPVKVSKKGQQKGKLAVSKPLDKTETVSSPESLDEHVKGGKERQRGRHASSKSNSKSETSSLVEQPADVTRKWQIKRKDADEMASKSPVNGKKSQSSSQSECAHEKDERKPTQQSRKSLAEAAKKRTSMGRDRRSLRALVMNMNSSDDDSMEEEEEEEEGTFTTGNLFEPPIINDMMNTYEMNIKNGITEGDANKHQPPSNSETKTKTAPPSKKAQSAGTTKLSSIETAPVHVGIKTRRKRSSNSDVGDELSPPFIKHWRGRNAQRIMDTPDVATETSKRKSTPSLSPKSTTDLTSSALPRRSILRWGNTPRASHGIAHFAENLPSYSARKSSGCVDITCLPRYSTASPIHITEVTSSQPTIQHIAAINECSTKIVRPDSADEGVRRSKRTRVKPLDWYNNERIIYEFDELGYMLVAGIDLGNDDEPSKEKKLKRLLNKKRQKMRAPRTPRRLSMHHPFCEDVNAMRNTMMPVIDSNLQKEVTRDCIRSADTLLYRGPHGGLPYDEDKFTMAKALVQKDFSAGKLVIRPSGEKPRQVVKTDSLVFYIIHGRLGVTIHETTTILESGDFFYVPQGNTYSVKNLRNEEAKLTFYQHKHY